MTGHGEGLAGAWQRCHAVMHRAAAQVGGVAGGAQAVGAGAALHDDVVHLQPGDDQPADRVARLEAAGEQRGGPAGLHGRSVEERQGRRLPPRPRGVGGIGAAVVGAEVALLVVRIGRRPEGERQREPAGDEEQVGQAPAEALPCRTLVHRLMVGSPDHRGNREPALWYSGRGREGDA